MLGKFLPAAQEADAVSDCRTHACGDGREARNLRNSWPEPSAGDGRDGERRGTVTRNPLRCKDLKIRGCWVAGSDEAAGQGADRQAGQEVGPAFSNGKNSGLMQKVLRLRFTPRYNQ